MITNRKTKKDMLQDENMENIAKSRKIKNNTLKIWYKNGDIAIKLHYTNIIIYKNNGDIILNSGGWKSVTTKSRMTEFSPFYIHQKNHVWYVTTDKGIYNYYDGIIFDSQGNLKK